MSIPRLERIWLLIGGGMLVVFLAVLLATAVAMGTAPPSGMQTVDPQTVATRGMFAHPGVVTTGRHTYLAHILAYQFGYIPSRITIPAGATVVFHLATKDVIHGFEIPGTDVNIMVIPGYMSVVTHTFARRGTYLSLCNEYCGGGHDAMFLSITVQ